MPLGFLAINGNEGRETLKTYLDKYWEMFNEIDVAIRTSRVGLPTDHEVRKSLTKKPARNMFQLMDRIDEYKRVEEDQQQGKGKAKANAFNRKDYKVDRYNYNRVKRDFLGFGGQSTTQTVNIVFREPVH